MTANNVSVLCGRVLIYYLHGFTSLTSLEINHVTQGWWEDLGKEYMCKLRVYVFVSMH